MTKNEGFTTAFSLCLHDSVFSVFASEINRKLIKLMECGCGHNVAKQTVLPCTHEAVEKTKKTLVILCLRTISSILCEYEG